MLVPAVHPRHFLSRGTARASSHDGVVGEWNERHAGPPRNFQDLHDYAASLYTMQSCIFCLHRIAIQTLPCGHRICSACAQRFWQGPDSAGIIYIEGCPLCQDKLTTKVSIVPPTAGYRVSCLSHEDVDLVPVCALGGFGVHIWDYFDLVYITVPG